MRNILTFLFLLMACHAAYAAELFGTVDAISGTATLIDPSGKSTNIAVGLNIYEGQTIDSGEEGEVHLVTEDGGIIAVRPHTLFRVDEYKAEGGSADKIFMSLLKGTVRSITGWVGKFNNAAYRITTPTATIGIRGTDHETTVIDKGNGDEPGTYDHVNEGSTVLKTPHGSAEVTPGKFAFAARNKAAAPFFLAQAPRFLVNRKLRIEERIQQRKSFFHERLEQMRGERIKSVKSIHESRVSHPDEHRGSIQKQERGQATERRSGFREHRLEQARQHQQARRGETERNQKKQGEIRTRREQRNEILKKNNKNDAEQRRNPERRQNERLKRE